LACQTWCGDIIRAYVGFAFLAIGAAERGEKQPAIPARSEIMKNCCREARTDAFTINLPR
jgi:hypothetical protein